MVFGGIEGKPSLDFCIDFCDEVQYMKMLNSGPSVTMRTASGIYLHEMHVH